MITPYGLYLRNNVYIRQNFDSTSSLNTNTDKLTISNSSSFIASDGKTYTSAGFNPAEVSINTLETYKILKSDSKALATLNFNLPTNEFYELAFDLFIEGPGTFKLLIDGVEVETCYGSFPFKSLKPHKFNYGSVVQISFECETEDYDPIPFCGLDNILCYGYSLVNCDISNYKPPRTTITPKSFDILRGYKTYQTLQKLHAEISMDLVFYSDLEHTNFLQNADRVVVFCDEKNILYRGVLELGEVDKVGSVYIQQVKLLSSDRLGVGWL